MARLAAAAWRWSISVVALAGALGGLLSRTGVQRVAAGTADVVADVVSPSPGDGQPTKASPGSFIAAIGTYQPGQWICHYKGGNPNAPGQWDVVQLTSVGRLRPSTRRTQATRGRMRIEPSRQFCVDNQL